jgi:predicted dinucleotide-binding enzyme
MKIGVFGTGMVGEAIASKLVSLGHDVMMGSRESNNPRAAAWAARAGAKAQTGTFADAAQLGELYFNCTHGEASIAALRSAGVARMAGKILIDVANVLPPDRAVTMSLGERIQRAFPAVKVVKTLNTLNCELMVDPGTLASGQHTLFVSGDDAGAKHQVRALVESFGWQDIIDLGDITTAALTEAYLPLWLDLAKKLGTARFNIKVVR